MKADIHRRMMRLRTFSPSSSTVVIGMKPAFSNARHDRPFSSSGSVTTAVMPGWAETTSRINSRIALEPIPFPTSDASPMERSIPAAFGSASS